MTIRKLIAGTDGGRIAYPRAALLPINLVAMGAAAAAGVWFMTTPAAMALLAFVAAYGSTFALEFWRTESWPEVYRDAGYTPGAPLAARLALTYAVIAAANAGVFGSIYKWIAS